MATDATSEMSAAELLQFYVGLRLQNGDRNVPVQQILTEFPEYLRQRKRMRELVHEADEAIAAGATGPLDLEQVIGEVVAELAAEGITD